MNTMMILMLALTASYVAAVGCPSVVSVQASSQLSHWPAENLLETKHRTFWMSEISQGQNEWVQFEFAGAALVSSIEIRLNNGRQGNRPKIQGSEDGAEWVDLASVNAFDWPNDAQNFRLGVLELDASKAYKYYRYYSGPTVYVLINHIAFECVDTEPEAESPEALPADTIVECPEVTEVTASSALGPWQPINILDDEHRTFWMTSIDAGISQWITLSFDEPAYVSSAEIRVLNGRHGTFPEFQASHDNVDWETLASIHAYSWPVGSGNFRLGTLDLNPTTPYRYYRYHSDPTRFIVLNHITLTCQVGSTRRNLRQSETLHAARTLVNPERMGEIRGRRPERRRHQPVERRNPTDRRAPASERNARVEPTERRAPASERNAREDYRSTIVEPAERRNPRSVERRNPAERRSPALERNAREESGPTERNTLATERRTVEPAVRRNRQPVEPRNPVERRSPASERNAREESRPTERNSRSSERITQPTERRTPSTEHNAREDSRRNGRKL